MITTLPGTALIPLTQGKFAIVDEADYAELSKFKWQARCNNQDSLTPKWYASRIAKQSDGTFLLISMARAVFGTVNGKCLDHINGNSLDNRRCNLRWANPTLNAINRGKTPKKFTSKYIGVCFYNGRWVSSISINKKFVLIGRFSNEVEAARARDAVAFTHFGEFARLNFP